MTRETAPQRDGPDRRFFDLWSRFYDLGWVQRVTYRPVHDAVMRVLQETAPRRVLDVGCGTGLLAVRIRRERPGCAVFGCDFSPGMLAHACARERSVGWVRGDAGRLPFGDHAFDVLVSTEAFHWFPDQATALSEFFRVLVPDGRLLLALASASFDVLSEVTRVGSRLLGEPLYWPTRERLGASLRNAGFELEAQQRILRLPAPIAFPTYLSRAVRPR